MRSPTRLLALAFTLALHGCERTPPSAPTPPSPSPPEPSPPARDVATPRPAAPDVAAAPAPTPAPSATDAAAPTTPAASVADGGSAAAPSPTPGTAPGPTPPPGPGANAAVEATLPPMPTNLRAPATAWARMSYDEREEHMERAVMPAMRALFRAYDSTEYATVRCSTCHGANARQVRFRMPNTLPRILPGNTPEGQRDRAEHARMYAFMGRRVVPAMAQLLGTQPFNPQTRQGFGCGDCHPHD